MPSAKTLGHLKDTYKSEAVLLPEIERHVLKKVQQEQGNRRTDIIHPSSMSSKEWCPRHDYYGIMRADKSPDKGGASTFRRELIYDYGNVIHTKYQTWLWEMGVLWGRWKCHGEDCDYSWLGQSPTECPMCCRDDQLSYAEVPLEVPDLSIGGHADGLVIGESNRLIEIKSVGIGSLRFDAERLHQQYLDQGLSLDQVWWRIGRPFGKHLRQGLLYVALCQLAYPELNVDEIVFIYEWKPNQDTKSFLVKYNPRVVQSLLDKAREVHEAVGLSEPPPRPEWAEGVDGKVCRSCDYRGTCWGVEPAKDSKAPEVRVKRVKRKARPTT